MLVITPQRHDRAIERLTRAIRVGSSSGSLRCAKARSWQHLLDMTVEERAPIAVIDPYWGGQLDLERIHAINRWRPSLDIIAYSDFSDRPAADVMRLVRAGVDDIITLDVDDDVSRISQILLRYCNRRATSNCLAPLRALLSAEAWATLTEVFEQAESPIDVSALAQLQSCTPRTVRRRFRLVGLPPPHELIAWCRMIHAFGLIDAGRSVEAAARILGFSSGAALRRNLRILTGLTPTELARAGGVGGLIDRLAGRLSRCAQPQCATDSKRNLSRFDAGFGRPSNGNSSTGVLAEPTQAETSERSGVEPAVG